MHKKFLTTAAFLGAVTVAMGAFGAHTLKQILTDQSLAIYETAVRYQFYHVFALALAGILYKDFPNKLVSTSGWFFLVGMIAFCGSLYLLTYGSANNLLLNWAGPITPLGGLFFIAGWVLLALGIRKGKS
jgi:uncharacterized membrane protein YgdD (TMEM256/DUF423 family)